LAELKSAAGCLTEALANHYAEACAVSLHEHSHIPGVELKVEFGDDEDAVRLKWPHAVTDDILRCYQDRSARVNVSACAIALMLIPAYTEFFGWEQSQTGDRIDYYLRLKPEKEDLIFNGTARLEVSGIDEENPSNSVKQRIREKRARLNEKGGPGDQTGSTYICVVEFSNPKSDVVVT
jgi:hypothetical protein